MFGGKGPDVVPALKLDHLVVQTKVLERASLAPG